MDNNIIIIIVVCICCIFSSIGAGIGGYFYTKVSPRIYSKSANTTYSDTILKTVTGTVEECTKECDALVTCNGFFHDGTKGYLRSIEKTKGTPIYNASGDYYFTGDPPSAPVDVTAAKAKIASDKVVSDKATLDKVVSDKAALDKVVSDKEANACYGFTDASTDYTYECVKQIWTDKCKMPFKFEKKEFANVQKPPLGEVKKQFEEISHDKQSPCNTKPQISQEPVSVSVSDGGLKYIPGDNTYPTLNSLTIYGCDGPVSLVCPGSNVIVSGTITYGRWEQSTCTGIVPNPVVKRVYPLKSGIGLNKYTIPRDLRAECGEDPAPNIYKQYIITFIYGPSMSSDGTLRVPTQRTYKMINNVDYGGQGDLMVQTGTLDQVKVKCDSTSDCTGFFYNGTSGYLKKITPGTGVQNENLTGSYYYTGDDPAFIKTELKAGNRLKSGETIKSPNGSHNLVMQGDGNLVLYKSRDVVWSTNTNGTSNGLMLTTTGNLEIRVSGGLESLMWQSGSSGTGTKLVVFDDGNIVLTDQNGNVKWTRSMYLGDNGTVDGNRYCAGPWGNGTIDKNKKCTNGYTISTSSTGKFKEGQMVGCGDVLEMGDFGFQCL
jgi:hypothetical protein